MSEDIFELKNIHLSMKEKGEIVFTGEVFTDPKTIRIKVWVNGQKCDIRRIGAENNIAGTFKVKHEKKYRIRMEVSDDKGEKKSYSKTLNARENGSVLTYFVDEVRFLDDGSASIVGWALDYSPVSVSLRLNGDEEIRAEKFERADLLSTFPELDDINAGFRIKLTREQAKKFPWRLIFSGANGQKAERDFTERTFVKEKWKNDGGIKRAIARSYETLNEEGIRAFLHRSLFYIRTRSARALVYQKWIERIEPSELVLNRQRYTFKNHREDSDLPLFSIVVPIYKTPEKYLRALLDSVKKQTYGKWELILADAGADDSGKSINTRMLQSEHDVRIKYFILDKNAGISANTNEAIKKSSGDWIVFADHDDTLAYDALFRAYMCIRKKPDAGYIYSDEDKINASGRKRFDPNFKPDFNPDMLDSTNYISHLSIVKKSLLDEVGYLNPEFDGSQDYDLTLRCTEKLRPDQIIHIPEVLYHWRSTQNSTAGNQESKLYAFEAGKRAVQAHLDRLGIPGTVEELKLHGRYRIHYQWDKRPLVSIIIPNKDHVDDLRRCITSILKKTRYPHYEIIVVENNSTEPETEAYYKKIEKEDRIRVIKYEGGFNYSAINNYGVRFANGDFFLLLNNDTEVISPDWLDEMVDVCMRDDVGIVGAKLYYPDNTIQHAGVVIGLGGVAGHIFQTFPAKDPGFMCRLIFCQDYSAVTAACMLVKREAFEKAHGLSENLAVAFNDIDFCLKVGKEGYRVVFTPFAELYHYESKSRGKEDTPEKQERFAQEMRTFNSRWKSIMDKGDPCYNRHFTLKRFDCSFNEDLKRE